MRKASTFAAAFCLCALSAGSATADSIADFYGRTKIAFTVGAGAGGGYDLYTRVFTRYYAEHIPGKPTIVVTNMPGAGGRLAANYMFNVAAKDGSAISMPLPSTLISEALNPDKVKYRVREFGWIGTIATMTDVLGVSAETGVSTIEQAKTKVVVLGSTSELSQTGFQPALVNVLLGTRFKIVNGYKSMHAILLAQERGEVSGHTDPWVSWLTQRPELIRDGKIKFLIQFGPKVKELPDVPTFGELAKSPEQRRLVDFIGLMQVIGRSVSVPPNVPADRTAALRKAFDETMKDPAFVRTMEERKLLLEPRTGPDLEKEVKRILTTQSESAAALKAALKIK